MKKSEIHWWLVEERRGDIFETDLGAVSNPEDKEEVKRITEEALDCFKGLSSYDQKNTSDAYIIAAPCRRDGERELLDAPDLDKGCGYVDILTIQD